MFCRNGCVRVVLLLLVLTACGDPEQVVEPVEDEPTCSPLEARDKYEQLVLPLVAAADTSCSACHVSGTHLREYVQDTACATMACFARDGLADYDDPAGSKLLEFVQRGRDKDDPAVAALADKEYENLEAWLVYSAQCQAQACGKVEYTCAEPDPCESQHDETCGHIIRERPEPNAILEYGCEDGALAQAFYDFVLPWRGRCDHCHAPGGALSDIGDPPPPAWLDDEDSVEGAARTIALLEARELINAEFPAKSLLLAKPLHEELSLVPHGGGTKFGDQTDETYLDMFTWLYHYADCR